MVQPASKRLVTEEKLATKLATEVPTLVTKQRSRTLGELFDGVKPGKVSSSKAVVSVTSGDPSGFSPGGAVLLPADMYDIAECNWNAQTLSQYGGTIWTNMPKANTIGTDLQFTVMHEGQYAVISSYTLGGVKNEAQVWIDDQPVMDWYNGTEAAGVLQTDRQVIPMAVENQVNHINIRFPKRGVYKIRTSGLGSSAILSLLACNPDGRFFKPGKQRVLGTISDSWYDTVSLTNTSLNAASELSARMGWKHWNLAVGGSGFINPSDSGAGNPRNFSSDAVFASLAKAPPMDLLLLNGSVNDLAYTTADVVAAMQAFFTRWRTVRPDTPIVWQGLEPQSYFENIYTTAALVAREEALRAVAAADPNVIGTILPAKENWMSGTGSTAAPNGTGNQDFVIGGDGIHLSAFGTIQNGALVHERLKPMTTWKVAA